MKQHKIILFDVDGVLIVPPQLFSEQYCEKYGVASTELTKFYSTDEFSQALLGKFDLKDALRIHNDLWRWNGPTEELVNMWLESENYPNQELLRLVAKLRQEGAKIYLATHQEKYRRQWLESVIFKKTIDGIFCSCDLGYHKHENHFWEAVLEQLEVLYPGVTPNQIVYFDDKQSLVDKAREFGIVAHLYTSAESVKKITGSIYGHN